MSYWLQRIRDSWLYERLQASWFLSGLAGVAVLVALVCLYYGGWALAFDMRNVSQMPLTTVIYDRNGAVLQRIFGEDRIMVTSDEIAPTMKEAVVATEDQRFYHHFGIDPIGIFRATVGDLLHKHIASGASTITQQLARNSAQMSQRTIDRKLKEIFLAFRIEATYSKDQILTFYLNRVFFGRHFYGIGAAADAYFGKQPKDLTLSESAMLAGIISGPNSFSPWRSPAKAREAKIRALTRMAERGYITTAERDAAIAQPLALRPLQEIPGTHAAEEAQLEATKLLSPEALTKGGLKIYTTIDLAFQQTAEAELEQQLESVEETPGYAHPTRAQFMHNLGDLEVEGSVPYLQGAFVAVSNADGGILALVGGRSYEESHFDRATEGARQVGSTMKPFVYANAFDTLDISALTQVDHSPFDLRESDHLSAVRSDDPDYITVRQALERSDNYAAERTVIASGVDSFAFLFQQASGVTIPPYPSSALGACELTPLQLVSAFTIFPNQGVKIAPYLIERITTHDDKPVYQHIDERRRILSPQIAFQIANLLQGVVDNGTGRAVRDQGVTGDIGGKTGTTNDFKDSWFVGFSSEITAGTWIGFDRPQTIEDGGFASRLAAPVWGRIMAQAGEHYLPQPFVAPPGLFQVQPTATEQVFGFFGGSKQVASGQAEYLREDQRSSYLAKIGDPAPAPNQAVAADAGAPEDAGVFGWVRHKFQQWTDDSPAPASASLPDEPDAPKAVPVTPSAPVAQ